MAISPEVKRLHYGYEWQAKIRPAAVQRAGGRCERCGRPWKPLDLAHLDGDPANRDDDNLALLCRTCHRENDYPVWRERCWRTRANRKDRARPIFEALRQRPAAAD